MTDTSEPLNQFQHAMLFVLQLRGTMAEALLTQGRATEEQLNTVFFDEELSLRTVGEFFHGLGMEVCFQFVGREGTTNLNPLTEDTTKEPK